MAKMNMVKVLERLDELLESDEERDYPPRLTGPHAQYFARMEAEYLQEEEERIQKLIEEIEEEEGD